MGLDGIYFIFEQATLDKLNVVSNLSWSIWVWLIPQGIPKIIILDLGSIMYIVI